MIDEVDGGGILNPVIKDVDGEENLGCFAKTEVVLNDQPELEVIIALNENKYSDIEKKCKFVTEDDEPIPGLKVRLSNEGCNHDEFITDENGEIVFRPLVNKDCTLEQEFRTNDHILVNSRLICTILLGY